MLCFYCVRREVDHKTIMDTPNIKQCGARTSLLSLPSHKRHSWGVNVLSKVVKHSRSCNKQKLKFVHTLQQLHTEVWSIVTSRALTVHLLLWLLYIMTGLTLYISLCKLWNMCYMYSMRFKDRIAELNQTYSRLRSLLVHSGPSWHFPVDRPVKTEMTRALPRPDR